MNKYHPGLVVADHLAADDWPLRSREGSDQWDLARPLFAPSIRKRFALAWGVFTGRYDALKWRSQ